MRRLKTVYVRSTDSNLNVGTIDKSDYYKSFSSEDTVERKEMIVFTEDEYNDHIKAVVQGTLRIAAENAGTEEESIPMGHETVVSKDSILKLLHTVLLDLDLVV